jgi:surface antigen
MTIARLPLALALAAAVAGCEPYAHRVDVPDVAVIDVLGPQIGGDKGQMDPLATGTLLGVFSGTEAGRSLDRADRRLAEEAARESLIAAPGRQVSRWSNPGNGHSGSFVPRDVYASADGLACRDYTLSITVGGLTQDAYGTACRDYAGAWRIVETPLLRSSPARRAR